MGVTVVRGRCGSGKSRLLMERIKELIADPFEKIIVVVPGQLTFETEKKIMRYCGVRGILGLQVMSVSRLAMKILDDACAASFLSNAQKAVLVSRALADVSYGGGISGLEASAAELMDRLKSYSQTPESLLEAAGRVSDGALSEKLRAASRLYARYLELCGGKPDVSDMYSMAARAAAKSELLRGAHMFIDGLDSASPAVFGFLAEAAKACAQVMITFRSGDGGEGDLYDSEMKDMRRFIEAVKHSGEVTQVEANLAPRYSCAEMEFLNANLYRYPYRPYEGAPENITLAQGDSPEKEVEILAGNILSEVKAGRRFRDIAVVVGGINGYLPAIKTKFSECGIPFFFDERRSLAENALFSFLYSALRAAAGDYLEIEGYIYGMCSPLSFGEKRELKAYADRYAITGWRYMSAFKREGSQRAEELRRKAAALIDSLSAGIRKASVKEQIGSVKRFLEDCGAEERIRELCESLDGPDTRAEYSYFAQAYAKTVETLDGIAEAYPGMIRPEDFADIVKTGLSAAKIALIPPCVDEVAVFDISTARLPEVNVLFAAGVHDGLWPPGDAAAFFSRAEREALCGAGADIGTFDVSSEKLKVYSALVKPKEKLYLSYNTGSGRPSVIIDRIKRLFPGIRVRREPLYISASGAETKVLHAVSRVLYGAENEASPEAVSALAAYIKDPSWKDKASGLLLRDNAAALLGAAEAAELYGDLKCSCTRIEGYYKCPFKHFLDFGLKLRPKRDYTDDSMDTGSFLHLALELFAKGLIEDGADLRAMPEKEAAERMRRAAHAAARTHDAGKLLCDERFAMKYELLAKELENAALRIRKHFQGCGARIISSEQVFSDYTVETSFGKVRVGGKIDRIDEGGGYYRVVDYKSSKESFSLKEFLGGVSLQLPVYIAAAGRILEKGGKNLKPAGGYYMRIGDGYAQSEEEIDKEARMSGLSVDDVVALSALSAVGEDGNFQAIDLSLTKNGALNGKQKSKFFSAGELKAILERADALIREAAEMIYSGDTSISPVCGINGADACGYCDYGSVCMADEGYAGNNPRKLPSEAESLFREGCDE